MKPESLGVKVREIREARGISQSRLASLSGLAPAQISRLESGERENPTFEAVVRLADALDVSLDDLAGLFRDDPGVSPEDWTRSGFTEVDEVVPGRVYEAWADGRSFRISITRGIVSGSTIEWNSSIDELSSVDIPDGPGEVRIWTRPVGIPARLLGETPSLALRDAMRWLANWGGFDEMGRARRDDAAAEHMDPSLRHVADRISQHVTDLVLDEWRDEFRVRWSAGAYQFYISRANQSDFALMAYLRDTSMHKITPQYFPLTDAGADGAAATIRGVTSGTYTELEPKTLSAQRLVKPADPDLLDIDVRSANGIIIQRGAAMPQFTIWLRITNHAPYAIRVTHLTIDVWFGQPTTELSLDQPIDVGAQSTVNDVRLKQTLDESKFKFMERFLESKDFGKTLYLNLAVTCDSSGGPFSKNFTIERRDPELTAILR